MLAKVIWPGIDCSSITTIESLLHGVGDRMEPLLPSLSTDDRYTAGPACPPGLFMQSSS